MLQNNMIKRHTRITVHKKIGAGKFIAVGAIGLGLVLLLSKSTKADTQIISQNVTSGDGSPTQAGLKKGDIYVDTKNNAIYVWDGVKWVQVLTTGPPSDIGLKDGQLKVDPSTGEIYVWDDILQKWVKLDKSKLQGATGPQGIQGIQGLKGDTGLQGIQGIKGDTGLQGIQGDIGLQGIQGIKGDVGQQGVQGIKGDVGQQGVQGNQGVQGIKGDVGQQGIQGIQGIAGIDSNPVWQGTNLCFKQPDGSVINCQNLQGPAGGIDIPIGTILAWDGQGVLLPNFVGCNGQVINDPASPYNGKKLNDLNGENRFLRGNAIPGEIGGTGGSNTHIHKIADPSWSKLNNSNSTGSSYGEILKKQSLITQPSLSSDSLPPYINIIWVIRIK